MHPISALMVASYLEEERSRADRLRRLHARRREDVDREKRPSWIERIRIPRPSLSGS